MGRLLGLVICGIVISCFATHAQTGIVDYVPNGSFEYTSKPDALLGVYDVRFGKYSLFWRQFHSWTVPNEAGTIPLWPITSDRVWTGIPFQLYDPVSCSSSDLFSEHLPNCVIGPPVPSHFDIPENWDGTETIRAGSVGKKYAGLYNRLNGIKPATGGGFEVDPLANPATGWWREYLEVELLCELEAGREYTLSFWASLAEMSNRTIPIQARVSQQPYHKDPLDDCKLINDADKDLGSAVRQPVTDGPPGYILTSVNLQKNGALPPNDGWIKTEANFIATGGEKYLTIGYFGAASAIPNNSIADCIQFYQNAPLTPRRAYVYVDDVRLRTATAKTCECNALVWLEPILPSPEEGKCCYKVVFKSSGEFNFPTCNSCTIESVVGVLTGSTDPIFNWSSTDSHGPIVGDGIPIELGTICIDDFFEEPQKDFEFKLYDANEQLLCTRITSVQGCVQRCNCFEFNQTVSISTVSSGNNACCYRVALDARILSECSQIASVKVYKGTWTSKTEITSAAYNSLVPTTFHGYLYTFCPPEPITFGLHEFIIIEFRDASGEIICHSQLPPFSCECDCNSSKVEVTYRAVSGPEDACCYDVVVRNTGDCKVSFKELLIQGKDMIWLDFTGLNGWVGTHTILAGNVLDGRFTKPGAPASLYTDQEITVGRVCPDACSPGDLSKKPTLIYFTVNGVTCGTAKNATTSTPELCPMEVDCDKFTVIVSPSPTATGNCCWFGVYVKVDLCEADLQGLYLESAGFPTQPVSTNKQHMVWSWQCQPKPVIVHLKRADGTILCTKTATYPPQYTCASTGNPASIVARSDEKAQETDSLKNISINNEMQSLVISRDSETVDSVFTQLQTNWVVYNTEMQIVAQKTLTGANNNNVQDVLRTLPSAVYILQGTDVLGNSISRRVYVRP